MLKKILTGVAIAMLVVGIGLVAFPPISNFIGTQISNRFLSTVKSPTRKFGNDENTTELPSINPTDITIPTNE